MFATSNVLRRKDWGKESKASGAQSADLHAADKVEGEQSEQDYLAQMKLFEIFLVSILMAECHLLDLKPLLKIFNIKTSTTTKTPYF